MDYEPEGYDFDIDDDGVIYPPKRCQCCGYPMGFNWDDKTGHFYTCDRCKRTEFDACKPDTPLPDGSQER